MNNIKLTKSLRMLLLGMWLVVTGLLLVVSTVIAIMTKTEETSVDGDDGSQLR
jgi:hypothetical protein